MRRTLGNRNQEQDARRLRPLIGGAQQPSLMADHGALSGLGDDDHSQYVHISAARTVTAQHSFAPATVRPPFTLGANAQGQTVTGLRADQLNKPVIAGLGLTGGGVLTTSVTLDVGAGDGIEVGLDAVSVKLAASSPGLQFVSGGLGVLLTSNSGLVLSGSGLAVNARNGLVLSSGYLDLNTPGTLSVSSANNPAGNHTHAITSSSDPGAAASLLASAASGQLALKSLLVKYDASNYALLDCSGGGNLILQPTGDITLDPTGGDVLPNYNYFVNLGAINKKYLTLHAAELWVETLVAQNTIATIGGRILVGPTTTLTEDLSGTNLLSNAGFETAGGGGSDVFANWTENVGTGAIAQDSGTVYEGSYSAKLTRGLTDSTYIYQNASVTAGERIGLTIFTRGSSTIYPGRYEVYDVTNSAYIITKTNLSSSTTTWTRNDIFFTVPAGCTTVRVYLWPPNSNTVYCFYDSIFLGDGQVTVKHNEMTSGDIVYSEADGHVEFMQVKSVAGGSGPYTYDVARNLDRTGPNDWYAGDALFNTGQAGDGFIDLYSIQGIGGSGGVTEGGGITGGGGYGPSIVGQVRNTATYNDFTEHWAVGNLNGLYGYGTDTYGAAFGKYASGSTWVALDATNGFRVMNGSSTQLARWDASGNILVGQAAASQCNVYITSGAVKLRNNTTDKIVLTADGSASFEGVLNIGTSGGIFQGTGTFASPTTALKIYNSSGVGLLEMWGGGTKQVYMDSDGSLKAGGGVVLLNSNGIRIIPGTTWDTRCGYQFYTSGGTFLSGFEAYKSTTMNYSRTRVEAQTGCDSWYLLTVTSPSGKDALVIIAVDNGTNIGSLYVQPSSITINRTTQVGSAVGGLYVGSATKPTVPNGNAHIETDIRLGGGIYAGNLSGDPATGNIIGTADLKAGGGIVSGSSTIDPGTGDVQYTANLRPYRNSTAYTAYAYIPLTSPLTNTSWDGDAKTTGSYAIDTSAWGAPVGIKAAYIRIAAMWASANNGYYVAAKYNTSAVNHSLVVRGNVAGYNEGTGLVPCDSNGDFAIEVSGAATSETHLQIWGYFI